MRRFAVLMVMLTAALLLYAQPGGRQQFDLFGGNGYKGADSTIKFTNEDMALMVSGRASGVVPRDGGGYIIETRDNLEFSGGTQLIIRVSGLDDRDVFSQRRMYKLELNKKPRQTVTPGMKNRVDPDYVNARNGDAVFDLPRREGFKSINLVFFDCTVANLKIEVFYE
jgi:hypothetical protein